MTTLTEAKRQKHPLRYLRKDARTAIYKTLYGVRDPGQNTNDPSTDNRHLPHHWDYQNAEAAFKFHLDAASFTPEQVAMLERRLETLRFFRKGGVK